MTLDAVRTCRVILTGGRRTYSGPLGNHQVKNGVITLHGSGHDILRWQHHIEAMWQGYPEGDPRIHEAAAAIAEATAGKPASNTQETSNGQGDVQGDGSKPDRQAGALGHVLAQQPAADQAAVHGSGAAGGEAGQAAAAASGGNGSASQLTADEQSPAALMKAAAASNPKLARAIAQLDHSNDGHWTQEGKPRLDVLESFYGASGLKRADVDAITGGAKRNR